MTKTTTGTTCTFITSAVKLTLSIQYLKAIVNPLNVRQDSIFEFECLKGCLHFDFYYYMIKMTIKKLRRFSRSSDRSVGGKEGR